MGMISKFSRQMELMARMFERTGAISPGSMGVQAEASLRQATFRCAACRSTEACADWLDEARPGSPPPAFCPNADLIGRLADEVA